MIEVVIIRKHDPDSYVGSTAFAAVAESEKAAKQWIKDEVTGLHHQGQRSPYASGQKVKWWIQNGYFSLTPVRLHKEQEKVEPVQETTPVYRDGILVGWSISDKDAQEVLNRMT